MVIKVKFVKFVNQIDYNSKKNIEKFIFHSIQPLRSYHENGSKNEGEGICISLVGKNPETLTSIPSKRRQDYSPTKNKLNKKKPNLK